MPVQNCRHFSGYKPCKFNESCNEGCRNKDIPSKRILFVHLGALGAVLRSTALMPAIHSKYQGAHITWVTQRPANHLLKSNPLIDRILTTSVEDILALSCLEFDIAFCLDKSLTATGLLKQVKVDEVFGFQADPSTGAIVPASPEANYLWSLGLSNEEKFFFNKKPETQLSAEALGLQYKRDEYNAALTPEEMLLTTERRRQWAAPQEILVGLNTGCSDVIPYKKLSIESHRQMIPLLKELGVKVVLLGGPEDKIRNQQIAHGMQVIASPTDQGLRDGLISVNACDIVVSGDSLGMHMAIALKKWTVAWFGPTCAHEIDLFDRGVKVQSTVACSPCWKRTCLNNPMCYDQVRLEDLIEGVRKGIQWLMSFSTPRLSVISSLPSLSSNKSKKSFPLSL